jgi:two-component system sensor histidine kinase VicK
MQPYQEIVETVPIFFFIWDLRKKTTVFFSERFYHERQGDYYKSDKESEDLRQYISPEDQGDYDAFFENLSQQDDYRGQIILKAGDKLENIKWLSLETYPMIEDGEVNRLVGHIRDVTYEKENSQSLNEQLQSLDVIAFMLAHELSSPISNIMGLSDFLKEKVTEDDREEYLHFFDKIYNYGGEVLTLARGMVSLINLQGLKHEKIKKVNFSLRSYLQKEVEDFYFRDEHKKIKIAYELGEEASIEADKSKLKLAIGEILLYLVKKSKGLSDIIISMPQRSDEKYDDICIYSQRLNLPKAEIYKILDISAQLKLADVTGRKISGMLELVIANEIIQLHDGRLDIYESDEKEGIKIQLPASG